MSIGPRGGLERELRAARALCYVEDLEQPVLADDDLHHLRDVLRLRDGEPIALSDGAGRWREARLLGARRGRAGELALDAVGEIRTRETTGDELTVAFALPKGERAEWAVQKLTELGVDRIVGLLTERTVVRLDAEERARRTSRLARIAREASGQSRRTVLPALAITTLAELAASTPALALAEPGGRAVRGDDRMLVVGPEGGFAPDELELATELVDLGETVLRTETAAVAAAVLLGAARRARRAARVSTPAHSGGATL